MSPSSSHFIAQCPVCAAAYADQSVRLIREAHCAKLFHCTCASCGHAMLAVILESGGWVSSVGLMTDLEAGDAARFQGTAPINADECVYFHQHLNEQSADLCRELSGLTASGRP